MKKIVKKIVIGTCALSTLVLITMVVFSKMNTTEVLAKGNTKDANALSVDTENLANFNYNEFCNNSYSASKVEYEITTAEEFVKDFKSSLNSFSNNGSWLLYSDKKDEVPYMLGYIKGLGNIKGMRESTCGDNLYSSWIYVIEDEYFSRITLSSTKLDGYEMLPANSEFYYSVETWYSNEDKIQTPVFAIVDGEVINDYKKNYQKDNLNVDVLTPTFTSNYQIFEGDFLGLEKNTTKLYGISNSEYNRDKFSYNDLDESLITNFSNFWSVKTATEDIYLMNGYYAELQLKKLLISMFSINLQPCNDFEEDCLKTKEEICVELGSFYNADSIQSQFFSFDFDFVTKEYYENNIISCNDKENYGYYNMTKKEYEELEHKPSLIVYEEGEKGKSIISFDICVNNTKINILC